MVLFLPKLQSQIAEFLQNHYLFVFIYSTSLHALEWYGLLTKLFPDENLKKISKFKKFLLKLP